jgi:hypothetical protein
MIIRPISAMGMATSMTHSSFSKNIIPEIPDGLEICYHYVFPWNSQPPTSYSHQVNQVAQESEIRFPFGAWYSQAIHRVMNQSSLFDIKPQDLVRYQMLD